MWLRQLRRAGGFIDPERTLMDLLDETFLKSNIRSVYAYMSSRIRSHINETNRVGS